MPLPNVNDKSFTSTQLNNSNSPSSYRERVREKIQNSPRNNSSTHRSIDLSISRENTFFRPSSRLRFSTENIQETNNDSDEGLERNQYQKKNSNTSAPAIRARQIVFYNQTYVPSASDSNNQSDSEIRVESSESNHQNDNFNRDFENVRRHNVSRPNSRESFYPETSNHLKLRAKSAYINGSSPNQQHQQQDKNRRFEKNTNHSHIEENNFMKTATSRRNSRTDQYAANNFDNNATRSTNDFNFNSGSRSNLNEEEQRPVPKPRKKDPIMSNKLNLTIHETDDFRIRRTNPQISSRVVTPRIGYIPSPRNTNMNQLNSDAQFNSNNHGNGLEKKRVELTQEYVKYQTSKSPIIHKQENENHLADRLRDNRRSNSFYGNKSLNPNIIVNFNDTVSSDSYLLDADHKYNNNSSNNTNNTPRGSSINQNWKKRPI